ncbi:MULTISPECIES: hypothetical protein [Calothrix]|uniref:Uncharacterized protein n=2 Tax=Calothrix TaxID=1186 RepID=A0ABR8AAX6_9CYAN|nr:MULTISPECIES: hypothetical protein [Calothrix]MBD2196849.1 hypothetical protein [Calothrix parietina FACHB-288]MBD2225481.1 hypothetical protein [Calothrix anomala FACHB-343]
MKILKLILLACPAFLASVLFITNPAHAASINSAPATEIVMVASAQPNHELIAPKLTSESNPIMDQLGCSCAACVKSKFHLLQGKLPL